MLGYIVILIFKGFVFLAAFCFFQFIPMVIAKIWVDLGGELSPHTGTIAFLSGLVWFGFYLNFMYGSKAND